MTYPLVDLLRPLHQEHRTTGPVILVSHLPVLSGLPCHNGCSVHHVSYAVRTDLPADLDLVDIYSFVLLFHLFIRSLHGIDGRHLQMISTMFD
jgi:hypothetical protein